MLILCASFPTGAKTDSYRIAKRHSVQSSFYACLDGINNILHIIICNVWPCRQTHTYLEDSFRYTIHVCRSILILGMSLCLHFTNHNPFQFTHERIKRHLILLYHFLTHQNLIAAVYMHFASIVFSSVL